MAALSYLTNMSLNSVLLILKKFVLDSFFTGANERARKTKSGIIFMKQIIFSFHWLHIFVPIWSTNNIQPLVPSLIHFLQDLKQLKRVEKTLHQLDYTIVQETRTRCMQHLERSHKLLLIIKYLHEAGFHFKTSIINIS